MNKYRNVKVELDGYKFDSKREAEYYQELCLRKKAGDVKEFEIKPAYEVGIRKYDQMHYLQCRRKGKPSQAIWGQTVFTYTPDFVVDGELVDVKGFETPVFKLKAKILAALGLPVKAFK